MLSRKNGCLKDKNLSLINKNQYNARPAYLWDCLFLRTSTCPARLDISIHVKIYTHMDKLYV